jgi:energy-coupling factor transporter ATP-binding protein EcfA2
MIRLSETKTSVAVPQENGSDTLVFLSALENNPVRKIERPHDLETTIFDGKVAVRHAHVVKNNLQNAPKEHHNIHKAIGLLRCWPEVYTQFSEIIREFQPMYLPNNEKDGQFGSMSHQPPATFGSMWATVNDHICLSQAFVHELAHNKLFCLGQQFEGSSPLFLNDENELYDSPIRLDIPRPISAVFHGVYAFTHVLSLDLKILRTFDLEPKEINYIVSLANKNANRIRMGLEVITKCAIPSPEAEKFVKDTIEWAEKEIRDAENYLTKIDPDRTLLIIGPSGSGKTSFCDSLSKRLDKQCVSLDTFCWDYWYSTPFVQGMILRLIGESKRFVWNNTLKASHKENLINDLINKGLITKEVMDALRYQLIAYAVTTFKNSLIDCGSGHAILSNFKSINNLKKFLSQNHVAVIQIKPVADVERTMEILKSRVKSRNYPETEAAVIRTNIINPSYRSLSDYVIDSNASTESCIDSFLQLCKPSQKELHSTNAYTQQENKEAGTSPLPY